MNRSSIAALFATVLLAGSIVVGLSSIEGGGASASPPQDFCSKHPGHPVHCPTTPPTSVPTSPSSVPTSPSSSGGGGGFSCVVPIGVNCGPYSYAGIPMSNGFNTYVSNQDLGIIGTQTVSANDPGDWKVVSNLTNDGGRVQTYPDVQQLTNDWNGSGWGNCGGACADTPWRQLSTLKINYNETSPQSGASYQFSPDVWGPGPWDIMFWVDTHGRCNEGAFGPTLLGHFTMDGQNWTAHQYGTEIILVLDGAGGPGTCAQQPSGTIDILAGLNWLWNNNHISGTDMTQLNTGWEITQSSGQTFRMNSYSITAN